MIKAIIFDLDDTLISEKEYIKSGFREVSRKISYENNIEFDKVFKKMIKLFEESSNEVFNRVLDSFEIKYTKEKISELIKTYREHIPDIKFFDDVIPTIKKLKSNGYKIGIITDGYKETQVRKIEVLHCEKWFDEIIITDEIGRAFWKPHEKPYKLIAKKLNLKLEEIAYVGDNVNKDFITANKLGIMTIFIERIGAIYKCEDMEQEYLARYSIKSLYEIFKLIQ